MTLFAIKVNLHERQQIKVVITIIMNRLHL